MSLSELFFEVFFRPFFLFRKILVAAGSLSLHRTELNSPELIDTADVMSNKLDPTVISLKIQIKQNCRILVQR